MSNVLTDSALVFRREIMLVLRDPFSVIFSTLSLASPLALGLSSFIARSFGMMAPK